MPKKVVKPTKAEVEEIQRIRFMEEVATLVLQLKTNQEIIEEMNSRYPNCLSEKKLRTLFENPEYREIQERAKEELKRDPRRSAVSLFIGDMLPTAMHKLKEALTGEDVPWTTRRWAVETVLKLAGVAPEEEQDEELNLQAFLHNLGVRDLNINVLNVVKEVLPPEYLAKMEALEAATLIEGEVVREEDETASLPPPD